MKKKLLAEEHADCVVGRFFHGTKEGKVCWQGRVIGRLSDDRYLVQLFEWAMGEASVQRIVTLSEMSPCFFYSDADEMKYSYDHGATSRLKAGTREQIKDY